MMVASKSEGNESALRLITSWKLWVVFSPGLARWHLLLDQVSIRPRPRPDPGMFAL